MSAIITVTNAKGGVGKTTTAITLAAVLNGRAATALLDGDARTWNATKYAARCEGAFPFPVEPMMAMASLVERHEYLVVDAGQAPDEGELRRAAKWSALLVIPAVPAPGDNDGLVQTIQALRGIGATNYRVLLTKVGPDTRRAADELRALLKEVGAPVFKTEIPRLKAFEIASGLGEIVSSATPCQGERAWAAYVAVRKEIKL